MENSIYFNLSYFDFFVELSLNNQKSWFDVNKKRYETDVKAPFELFISDLILKMAEVSSDFRDLSAKDCIFRIYKDVRFSKDKTPYKSHCSASIHKGGKKSMTAGGVYIEIGAEKCAIYSGVYMPEKDDLLRIRERIYVNMDAFNEAILDKDFKHYFGEVRGEKNKRIDNYFLDKSQVQPLLFNKQYYVMHEFEAEKCLTEDFLDYVVNVWKSTFKFNRVLAGI